MPRGIPGSGKATKAKAASLVAERPAKKRGGPRIRRPIQARLQELKAKYAKAKADSEKRLGDLERKIVTLQAQAASQPTKEQIKAVTEGKTTDEIERDYQETLARVRILKAARQP